MEEKKENFLDKKIELPKIEFSKLVNIFQKLRSKGHYNDDPSDCIFKIVLRLIAPFFMGFNFILLILHPEIIIFVAFILTAIGSIGTVVDLYNHYYFGPKIQRELDEAKQFIERYQKSVTKRPPIRPRKFI